MSKWEKDSVEQVFYPPESHVIKQIKDSHAILHILILTSFVRHKTQEKDFRNNTKAASFMMPSSEICVTRAEATVHLSPTQTAFIRLRLL